MEKHVRFSKRTRSKDARKSQCSIAENEITWQARSKIWI